VAFYDFIKISTVIDLSSTEKVDALKELAQILCKIENIKKVKPVIDDMLKREESASTFIGQGVAIPYTSAPVADDFSVVIGRSVDGINYDAARGAQVHIIALVMSSKNPEESSHIQIRQEIASFFKSDAIQERILSADGVTDILELIPSYKRKTTRIIFTKKAAVLKRGPDPIIASSVALAKELKAAALVLLADVVEENDFLNSIKPYKKVIVITSNKSRFDEKDKRFTDLIQAPFFPGSRTGQIKIGILLAISRSIIDRDDRVVCVTGNSNTGVFDTIIALDIEKEFRFFLSETKSILPPDVEPEVLERILSIASEIALEGREGKPIGTIFVVGDTNSVNTYIRQLIINPFRGYSEVERNILDPALDETIKEFASIDGAFIITGDGTLLSAGSYLRPPADADAKIGNLPSGFGSRHAAAAGITVCTKALAITVSESTGMVTIFKNGNVMLSIAKPIAKSKSFIKQMDIL